MITKLDEFNNSQLNEDLSAENDRLERVKDSLDKSYHYFYNVLPNIHHHGSLNDQMKHHDMRRVTLVQIDELKKLVYDIEKEISILKRMEYKK